MSAPSTVLDIGVYGARGIPSTYSGYETFLTVLLPELVRRGHHVTIYCRRGEVDGDAEYGGVVKRFLPAIAGKQFSTLSHGAFSSIAARFRQHDVLLVVNVANAGFCAVARHTGQPVVLNTDGQEWLRGKWGTLGRRFFHGSARIARHCATALIADSAAMAHIYRDRFQAATTVIPYCWTGLAPADDPSVLLRLGVDESPFACIAGRLVPENNAAAVARAYVASSLPWPLLVLGEANYHSPVKREIESLAGADARVRLVGHVGDRRAYATLVRRAAVYLHAHSVGGINPSLVEAMGVGAFVLALDTPFNREALGECGLYFGSLDKQLVARLDHLQRVLPTDVARLRSAAATRAAERFSLDSVASAYEALLRESAARPSPLPYAMVTQWAHTPLQTMSSPSRPFLEGVSP